MSLGTMSVHIFALVFKVRFASSLSIVEVLCNVYGNGLVKDVRKLEKIDYNYRKLQLDLDFLQTCQYRNVFQSFCNLSWQTETYNLL